LFEVTEVTALQGLVSKKRGKIGNHRRPEVFREHILAIVREQCADFGPTLAREKLLERHGLLVPCETLVTGAWAAY
jgi:hypothetical protein